MTPALNLAFNTIIYMININKSKKSREKKLEVDLGERKISRMNFSYIVTIPKIFIKNSPFGEIRIVRITMLQDGCLKLTPVRDKNGKDEPDDFVLL